MSQSKYSIWLIPSDSDKVYLSSIIQSLSDAYDAPTFAPHCTIFSPISDLEALKAIIQHLKFKPFEVTMGGLNQSEVIWKTVFIELEANPHLTLLNYLFNQAFDPGYVFQPHLSLIYKEMDVDSKKAIINNLDLKKFYKMHRLAVVDTSGPVETWKSVYEENWNKIS